MSQFKRYHVIQDSNVLILIFTMNATILLRSSNLSLRKQRYKDVDFQNSMKTLFIPLAVDVAGGRQAQRQQYIFLKGKETGLKKSLFWLKNHRKLCNSRKTFSNHPSSFTE